jgi:hypothetical protein
LTLQSPLPPFVAFPPEYKEAFPQSDFTFPSGSRTMRDNLQTPSVHSWNIGVQRQIMRDTVIEVRYLGTRGSQPGFLGSASINSTTFGQTTSPLNSARQMYLRAEIRF